MRSLHLPALAQDGADVLLLPKPDIGINAGAGNDLICTAVSNKFATYNVTSVDGQDGTDSRYGPPPLRELSIERHDVLADRDRCDFAYTVAASAVLNMLAH